MSTGCAAVRAIAPELALGIAEGEERAAALDHLASCDGCRRDLAGLAATVDALVQTAPSAEPSSGFEVRALASFEPAPPRADRSVARRRVLLAAAAVIAVLAIGLGARVLTDRGGSSSVEQASTSATAPLTTPRGREAGEVRVERTAAPDGGTTSDLVVSLAAGAPQGTYRVECDYESGRPYRAGELEVGPDGLVEWRATVSVPTYDLTRVRLVSTSGTDNLEAEFPT